MGVAIFWSITAGFLFGVLLRSFFPIGISFVLLTALFALSALFLSYIQRRNFRDSVLFAFACIALGAGILRMDAATLTGDPHLTERVDAKVVVEGIVVEEPDQRESNVLVSMRADTLIEGDKKQSIDAKVLASVLPHTPVQYGDKVRVEGTLRLPEPFDSGDGRQFRYPEFLAVRGITYRITNAEMATLSGGHGTILKSAAIALKGVYIEGLQRSLPEPQAGLAGGITVGDKRSIGPELTKTFQEVSLVHIVVLSGYNITIVINAVGKMLGALPRSANYGISAAVVMLFVLMTGGAASAMRAGAMALIAMYARVSGRVFIASRVLAAFALVLVMWNPFFLAFDPSFQLSILATLGLIFLTPRVAEYLPWITEKWGLREIAASTAGTQIAVLPLLLFQNGQLSLVSLPANMLALVPTPLAMLFSFVASIGGLVAGPLAPVIGFPAYVLLSYVIHVAELLGSLPFAALPVPAFSAFWMVGAYAALILSIILFNKKSPRDLLPRGIERA